MTLVKRRIVAFVGAALMAGTLIISANAATTYQSYGPSGYVNTNSLYTVNYPVTGSYGDMLAEPGDTRVHSGHSNYKNSYKTVRYVSYYDVNGSTEIMSDKNGSGTSQYVYVNNYSPMNHNEVLRFHRGFLYNGANSSSSPVEYYHVSIKKTGYTVNF